MQEKHALSHKDGVKSNPNIMSFSLEENKAKHRFLLDLRIMILEIYFFWVLSSIHLSEIMDEKIIQKKDS